MNKDKDNKLDFSDIDTVLDFLDNEAPSETSLKQSQITKERYLNPQYKEQWYKKNSKRLDEPEYYKKLSKSQKQWHVENPGLAKERQLKPETIKKKRESALKHTNSPDYVHPRGMLGKKMSAESRQKHSEAVSGKAKPLEGNKKISDFYKGKKKDPRIVAKVSKTMKGRTTTKSRGVVTTVKTFEKLKQAADYFDVSSQSIKNWINKNGKTIQCSKTRQKLLDKGIKLNDNNYPIGFEWADNGENLKAKKVCTDQGIFENTQLAAKHYSISCNGMRYRCQNDKWPNFYYIKND